jgi:hypothetical protein
MLSPVEEISLSELERHGASRRAASQQLDHVASAIFAKLCPVV